MSAPLKISDDRFYLDAPITVLKTGGVYKIVDDISRICRNKGNYYFSKDGYYFRYHGEPIVKYENYKRRNRTWL